MDFSADSLNISDFGNFVLLKNFDSDLLFCVKMNSFLNFSEGALAKSFGHSIAADYWVLL
jgi:hypothetical protein